MKKQLVSMIILTFVLVTASGCLGPKPVLQSFNVHPPPAGSDQPYKVEAVVANQGPGEGQVQVEVTFVNKQDGATIVKEDKNTNLKSNETQHVPFEIELPESAKGLDSGSIDVQVEAHYPIE
jgi:hypothetical protein